MTSKQTSTIEQDRNTGIGGSDIAAILGLSPWRTPLQVWLEKTGREAPEFDDAARERMYWGTQLEDIVARHYGERHGLRVQRVRKALRMQGSQIVMGHIDRAVMTRGRSAYWNEKVCALMNADAVLEVKTAGQQALSSGDWGEDGTCDVPVHYWMQVQWYLGITRVERGVIAALFGGQVYREYPLEADADTFGRCVQFALQWWQEHVVGDVPPPPATARDVLLLFPGDSGKSVQASAEVSGLCAQAVDLKRRIDSLTGEYESVTDKIKLAMGDAAELVGGERVLATWRSARESLRTDWQAVARAAGATEELIRAHTQPRPGGRRFMLKGV